MAPRNSVAVCGVVSVAAILSARHTGTIEDRREKKKKKRMRKIQIGTLRLMPMEKREIQKFSFQNIVSKEQRRLSPCTSAVGKKGETVFELFFLFFPTAAGGAICSFLLQIINTLVIISSCDDRRSIFT